MADRDLRFGVYVLQDAPLDVLRRRWREAEELGFDQIWVADHTRDWRSPEGIWFDAFSLLAAMAAETETIRIGSLVANPILRPPAVLARVAATLDQLSQGRFELGIGTGIAGFDHDATGTPYWPLPERIERFTEYVEIVDELLTRAPKPVNYQGRWHSSRGLGLTPRPVRQPRPPLTIGGQSTGVLTVAARRGDRWNTHGPFAVCAEEILERTHAQNTQLDRLCERFGRDPAELRRSLLMIFDLDAWSAPDTFERLVCTFRQAGMNEFIACWPTDEQRPLFERAATELIPAIHT
jgi:alkanesulfonate monooxygenase SsuD/methylene tetrahydromethanopterin reductase-like flavin-dependent oxidoreductase (luciferase family)